MPALVIFEDDVALLAATPVASGSSVTSSAIDLTGKGMNAIAAQVEIAFTGGALVDATVDVLASVDGMNYDTLAFTTVTVTKSAAATVRKTFTISGIPYAKVRVNNPASTDTITASVKYAYRRWHE